MSTVQLAYQVESDQAIKVMNERLRLLNFASLKFYLLMNHLGSEQGSLVHTKANCAITSGRDTPGRVPEWIGP